MKEKKKKLTIKQKKFTAEYLKTGNAAEAARIAYKVSDDVAKSMGSENLAKPCIKDAVETAAQKLGITPEYVLGNYKKLIDYNSQQITKRIGGEFGSDIEEMRDANVAKTSNDSLGKHLGLFTEKIEVNDATDSMPQDEKIKLTAKRLATFLANPKLLKK